MICVAMLQAVEKLWGFSIIVPLMTEKQEVIARLYADMHLKCQSINLTKARELMPDEVTDEASMVEHAGDLVGRVGLKITAKAETEQKFNDLLMSFKPKTVLKGIVERAYVNKKDSDEEEQGGDDNQGGGGEHSLGD